MTKTGKQLLILGGTADGRHIAGALHDKGCSVIYSVAGLVRRPDLACEIVSGGFTQFGGLTPYIKSTAIGAILDVTHPYAQTMSNTAAKSAQECDVPYWRFHRLPWLPEQQDHWQFYKDWSELLVDLQGKKSVFLTAGQLPVFVIEILAEYGKQGQQQILRTAVKPKNALPASMTWHKAIGPFSLENEQQILEEYQVDALVSKNSGGASTQAKLFAARERGVPVLMFTRPELVATEQEFSDKHACQTYVEHWFNMSKKMIRD